MKIQGTMVLRFNHLVFLVCLLIYPSSAFGHGGGLNSAGCHNDYIHGGYHCHDGSDSGGMSWAGKKVYTNYDPNEDDEDLFNEATVDDAGELETAFPINSVVDTAQLKRVVDGDTVIVTQNGKDYKIRLYGIDSLEGEQAHGLQSNIGLFFLLEGKNIEIETKDYDHYGRVVAVIHADGENANKKMVRDGLAWQYGKYCKEAFCEQWKQMEEEARQES